MIVDPASLSPKDRYRWMISSIVPRPIALVSTISPEGVANLAPFSYFTGISSTPPVLAISAGPKRGGGCKDTFRNVEATKEMVVNVVSEDLAKPMVLTSKEWPSDTSEFDVAGLTRAPSDLVRPPRVAESPLAMECRLFQTIPVGSDPTWIVLGEIVRIHVRDDVMGGGFPDPRKLRPLARLGGDWYAKLGELIEIKRP